LPSIAAARRRRPAPGQGGGGRQGGKDQRKRKEERFAVGPGAFAAMVPWESGCDMKERMRRYSRTAHAFVLVAVLAEVERSGRRGKLPAAARRRCKPSAVAGRA